MKKATKTIVAVVVVALLVGAGGYYYYIQSIPKPVQNVSFMTDVFLYGKDSIFYPAISQGYYKQQGVDVSIVPGSGSSAVAQAVGSGAATFGFADSGSALLAISKGVPIKIVGMIAHNNPCSIVTLNGTGITKPTDLYGKTLGGAWGSGACEQLFTGFEKLTNLNASKISEVTLSLQSFLPALLAGKVDAVLGFSANSYLWQDQAAAQNRQVVAIPWSNYNFSLYSNAIIASASTIQNNPGLVKSFLSATYSGILWAYHNQTGAASLYKQYNPSDTESSSEILGLTHWAFSIWNQTLLSSATQSNPTILGQMTQSKMQNTINWISQYQNMQSIPVQSAYTNQFL